MRLLVLLLIAIGSQAQTFLGEALPGSEAKIFSVPIISSPLYERDFAISADGTEVYYSLVIGTTSARIVYRKFADGRWSLPKALPFSSGSNDIEPALSPDGKKLFFASNRGGNFDIYVSNRKTDGTWSDPVNLGSPINTEVNEFYPSVTEDGTLYYTARYASASAIGGEDIWYSKLEGDKYQSPQVLPTAVNSGQDEYNAFVDPKGKYILFGSFGRSDDVGRGDIYMSSKSENGIWQAAVHLGGNVNSNQLDYCPFVSPDGKLLFFTSERTVALPRSTNPFKPKEILKGASTTQGGGNIFWIGFN
jgi:Tol biopolymer transport system component